jgi:hypothetical protein
MLFDIKIYEHWIDNPGNETGSIKTIKLFTDPWDNRGYYAYSLFTELVNEQDGLWKDKKFASIDFCWGEVVVKKDDLLFFIDEVNKRARKVGIHTPERDKVMEIDENRNYRLEAIES